MNEYKVKSDYTLLRNKKQSIADLGDIYENDYMTISPLDDFFDSDQQVIPSDSNFKFSVRIGYDNKKRHARLSWLLNPYGEDTWTLDSVSGTSISNETYIRIKPDYSSLRDFAYYGSATEMVRACVNDVILNFPAELYYSEEVFPLDNNYKIIHNGYGIDAETPTINESEVYNPLRYLCLSSGNYDYYENGEYKKSGVTFTFESINCDCIAEGCVTAKCIPSVEGGSLPIIYTYKMGSDTWLVYNSGETANGKSIRPCKEAIDNFFNEIDDFEYVLLDRTSRPIYRATFETPYETDKGNFFTMQDYVWPSYNSWNPDVDSGLYGKYLTDLIKLAQWHDEYDSNNMWRMETHEAIKNLDWTFFRENGDTISDMSTIDTSKIEPIIQIYGRCFDGIKRYIDNIKCVNNVTYNEKNNLPDYHLSDVAELSGWEVYSINPTAQTETYCDNYYSGRTKGWNATEANIAFMRNLKINSQYIMSLKGTRDGLVTMLGLLGVKEGEYELTEHVAIASSTDSYCDFVKLTQYLDQDEMENPNEYTNMPLFKNVAGINIYRGAEMYDNQPLQDYLSGLALRVNVYHVDENNMFRYCTPWFDSTIKHDGNWYFQCKGGWGEHKMSKDIYAPQLTSATTIEENGIKIYDESEGYLKFASTIEEMLDFPSGKIKNQDICYVTDISGISGNDISHYFILEDVEKSIKIGDGGWKIITNSEIINNSTSAATKVLYLETIKEQTEGNNPHSGYGNYDNGQEYLDYMGQIFKYAIENSGLTMFTTADTEDIKNYKFNIEDKVDNHKCWYFSNMRYDYTTKGGREKDCCGKLGIIEGGIKALNDNLSGVIEMGIANSGITEELNPSSAIIKGDENIGFSETASDSIINLKNLDIVFHYPSHLTSDDSKKQWKKYIDDVVMEYVKQMLPATTIWNYNII